MSALITWFLISFILGRWDYEMDTQVMTQLILAINALIHAHAQKCVALVYFSILKSDQIWTFISIFPDQRINWNTWVNILNRRWLTWWDSISRGVPSKLLSTIQPKNWYYRSIWWLTSGHWILLLTASHPSNSGYSSGGWWLSLLSDTNLIATCPWIKYTFYLTMTNSKKILLSVKRDQGH